MSKNIQVQFTKPTHRYNSVIRTSACGDYTIVIKFGTFKSPGCYVVEYRGQRLSVEHALSDARDAVNLHADSIRGEG
jgi:hypothetical protein